MLVVVLIAGKRSSFFKFVGFMRIFLDFIVFMYVCMCIFFVVFNVVCCFCFFISCFVLCSIIFKF